MQKVAITGATGFVGLALTRELCRIGHDVVTLVRTSTQKLPSEVSQVLIGDLTHLVDGFGYGFAHHDRAGAEDSRICGSDLKKSENDKGKGRRNEVKSVFASGAKQSSAAVEGGRWTATASGLAETSEINSCLAQTSDVNSDLESTQIKDRLLSALNGVEVVVHTAARTHVMKETSQNPAAEFRRVNVYSTIALARLAAEAGVKRFVFLSSIKVNGERTSLNQAFAENDLPIPEDDYGCSKLEAEQALMQIADETGMEVVIIRPPLVYGPNAKGNFASLLKWIQRGVPLPLGAVDNQRSFIALDNLVDFIRSCLVHPKATNEVFVISDGEDVSTTELLEKVANAVGCKARLIPVPVSWMRLAAKLTGKAAIADRLFGSLRVDISKARQLLGWKPKVTMQQQLESMASQAASNASSGGGGFPPSRE